MDKETMNMFLHSEHLGIGQWTTLNVSPDQFGEQFLKGEGNSLVSDEGNRRFYRCTLPVLGSCSVTVHDSNIKEKNLVGLVVVKTIRRMTEEEMIPIFEYMRQSMPVESYYNDGGYGVKAKPLEVNQVWNLPQGTVKMSWDGFNYTRGIEPNHPQGDGMDSIVIMLRDCSFLQAVKDEECYGYSHWEDID